MRVLNERLAGRDLDLLDGIKVNDRRGWAQVLPDPDEPLVHIYAEGRDERASNELESELRQLVEEVSRQERGRESQAEVEPSDCGCFTSRAPLYERKAIRVEPLPDLAALSDDDLKKLIDELDGGGAGHLVPPPPPARQDRHPARRARGAAPEVGGQERPRAGRRRGPDPHPRRQGRRRRPTSRLSHVYCPSAASRTRRPRTTARKCGALLVRDEAGSDTTMSYTPDEGDEEAARVARRDQDRGAGARRPLGRRPRGGALPAREGPHDGRPLARLRRLPRRRHGLAPARACSSREGGRFVDRGQGQPQRHVPQPPADRVRRARGRRRAPDRQVPADLPRQ